MFGHDAFKSNTGYDFGLHACMHCIRSGLSVNTAVHPKDRKYNVYVTLTLRDDTEVTLERNPKTDGLRRATPKAYMRSH